MKEQREACGVEEKCRIVLSVWTGRRTATQVCRESKVSAAVIGLWQDRALSGMLEALEPRGAREAAEAPALPEAIRRLLERKVQARELCLVGRRPLTRSRPPSGRNGPAPAAATAVCG